jgi:putative transposase
MPEHVHLLLHPRVAEYGVADILSTIKRPVGATAITWLRANRPEFLARLEVVNRRRIYHRFWQAGAGQDRNINDPTTLHQVIEYIHANPVRRRLVTRATDWLWSSAADWSGERRAPLSVDRNLPASDVIRG